MYTIVKLDIYLLYQIRYNSPLVSYHLKSCLPDYVTMKSYTFVKVNFKFIIVT